MYGGREGQQGALADARGLIARGVAAALLGLLSATRSSWYDESTDSVPLEILAPHGAVAEAPERVVWRAAAAVAEVQLVLVDADLHELSRRRVTIGESADRAVDGDASGTANGGAARVAGVIALTNDERRAITAAGRCSLEVLGLGDDGELLAISTAAEITVDPSRLTPATSGRDPPRHSE